LYTHRTFLFILGYHEDYIIRRLHRSHATRLDAIVLISPSPLAGALKRAYLNLEAYLSKIGLNQPKLIQVPQTNIDETITTITRELRKQPQPIILDLTGGNRLLATITLLILLATKKQVEIYIQPETEEPWEIRIPHQIIKLIHNPLTEEKKKILQTIIENPGITIEELAKTHNKTPKTMKNYINQLKRNELIIQKGRKAAVYPTQWAKLII